MSGRGVGWRWSWGIPLGGIAEGIGVRRCVAVRRAASVGARRCCSGFALGAVRVSLGAYRSDLVAGWSCGRRTYSCFARRCLACSRSSRARHFVQSPSVPAPAGSSRPHDAQRPSRSSAVISHMRPRHDFSSCPGGSLHLRLPSGEAAPQRRSSASGGCGSLCWPFSVARGVLFSAIGLGPQSASAGFRFRPAPLVGPLQRRGVSSGLVGSHDGRADLAGPARLFGVLESGADVCRCPARCGRVR